LTICKNITDDGLVHIANMSTLRKLDLYKCSNITNTGLSHFKNLHISILAI